MKRSEKVKRGFYRVVVVGAALAGIVIAFQIYRWSVMSDPAVARDALQLAGVVFIAAIYWCGFWLLLSWIIRGFMD